MQLKWGRVDKLARVGAVGQITETEKNQKNVKFHENMTLSKIVSSMFLRCFSMLSCKETVSGVPQDLRMVGERRVK